MSETGEIHPHPELAMTPFNQLQQGRLRPQAGGAGPGSGAESLCGQLTGPRAGARAWPLSGSSYCLYCEGHGRCRESGLGLKITLSFLNLRAALAWNGSHSGSGASHSWEYLSSLEVIPSRDTAEMVPSRDCILSHSDLISVWLLCTPAP